jgi:hypothetical protein
MEKWFRLKKLTIDDELDVKMDGHAGIEGNKQISKFVIDYINRSILDKKIII